MESSTEPQHVEGSATTRRDALKLAGAAALGGMAASIAASETAGASVRPRVVAPSHFVVTVNGAKVVGLAEVDLMESSSDVTFVTDPTGAVTPQPGKPTAQRIHLTKDWSNTPEWYTWRQTVLNGKVDRRSISVIFHNDAGNEVGRINFFHCWPSKYTGPSLNARSSAHAVEKLEISYETLEWK